MWLSSKVIRGFILYGNKNKVTLKLKGELESLGPVLFKDLEGSNFSSQIVLQDKPTAVLVNLMDMKQKLLIHHLKSLHRSSPLIAVHCYSIAQMIDETLAKGFDAYIPIFNFSRDIEKVVEELLSPLE